MSSIHKILRQLEKKGNTISVVHTERYKPELVDCGKIAETAEAVSMLLASNHS